MNRHKLTQKATCAGCAAKLDQKVLSRLLKDTDFYRSENTIIGIENFDDAGVYMLTNGTLLVQTTDFFPPIVDDPYQFGQIAAANALSDIYVMGAEPITALNLCCFPKDTYPEEVYSLILEGAAERLKTAKCTLLGGHTIEDSELKFGIAVTGLTNEENLITNSAARPGEVLFLTKPLGTGIVTTAIKGDLCSEGLKNLAVQSMITLNKDIKDIMLGEKIKAATDITGFGLAGHGLEICRASGVRMRIHMEKLPVFEGVFELLNMGMMPAGSYRNRENFIEYTDLNNNVNSDIIFDAQTSGGVLLSAPEEKARTLRKNPLLNEIGEVLPSDGSEKLIELV